MSLTTFLENKDVRAKFSQEFTKPKFDLRKEILAPPITKHYGLVGTAFDYLMRFYVEYLNPPAITSPWVAENAIEKMRESGLALFQGSVINVNSNLLDKGEHIISEAKTVYSNYLRSGVIDDVVRRAVLLLAQLDTYFRVGIVDNNFGVIDEGDIVELLLIGFRKNNGENGDGNGSKTD